MNKETVKTKDIKLNDFIQISSDTKEASNIIWHVIDRKDDRLLLIWENYYLQGIYGDRSIYSDGIVDYSDSVIRGCAIKTYNDIFDDNTKKHVLTDLDTGDKLYVLSSEEFNEYSSLVNFGVFTNQTAKLTNWWLRDLSDMKGDILFVNNSGEIYTDGYMPETESFYYRFAMWVDLDLTVDRITSPFKIVRPKITIDLEFPRNSKCSFPDTTLLNMKKDAIFEYKNNIYILKGLSWVAGSEGEMLNVTCISIKKGKRTTFQIGAKEPLSIPDFTMSPYFYIGDNAHESMYIPVNGMDLYTISKEHRDMFIGQCAPNTVVNLCFFGDTPLGMAVYIEDKGYVRYI